MNLWLYVQLDTLLRFTGIATLAAHTASWTRTPVLARRSSHSQLVGVCSKEKVCLYASALKECFEVDSCISQRLIVTHSSVSL